MRKCLNFLSLISFLLFTFYFLPSRSPVLADNKCGVNIGAHHQEVTSVAQMTKTGGWVVALGTLGDCSSLENLFGKGLNVVIRSYKGGEKFTSEDATAWTASLGKMDTKDQKVYFMPWNEPDHPDECGGGCTPQEVKAYIDDLSSKLAAAGLLDSKVVLLSPMLDTHNPGSKPFRDLLYNGKNSLNEYDQTTNGSNYEPCQHPSAELNNCKYNTFPPQYFAVEAGVAGTCSQDWPCYKDQEIAKMLNKAYGDHWKNDGNFNMFAVFSYDPINGSQTRNSWNIFNASQTKSFYSANCSPGPIYSGSADQNKFDEWFKKNSGDLVPCGGCGYGTKSFGCTAAGTTPPEGDGRQCTLAGEPGTTEAIGTSRPYECVLCSKNIQNPISSCAETPTVKGKVSYLWNDTACDNYTSEKTWSGNVTVDSTNTIIPFVGKKGNENMRYYLADFFEGVAFNYALPYGGVTGEDIINLSGPFGKLFPEEIQNQYKRSMVYRAIDSIAGKAELPVHNYTVSLDNESAYLVDFAYHFPPEKPNTNDFALLQKWQDEYNAWKNTKWGRLWPSVPMFSREDSNGKIDVSIQQPGNLSLIPAAGKTLEETTRIKVPHVQRLYEAASAVQALLIPEGAIKKASIKENSNILTNTNNDAPTGASLLASSTLIPAKRTSNKPSLIAQASQEEGIRLEIEPSYGNGQVQATGKIYSEGCDGHFYFYVNGVETMPDHCCLRKDAPGLDPFVVNPEYTGGAIQLSVNVPVTVTYFAKLGQAPRDCSGKSSSKSCTYLITSSGEFTSNCGPGQPLPPSCGTAKSSYNECKYPDALGGDGDTLCCNQISAKFTATDKVLNTANGNPLACGIDGNCSADVERKIQIGLTLPLLGEIWEKTTDPVTGVFNIFRPAGIAEFKDTKAKDKILYSASGDISIEPTEGDFYYPYLGGIQTAKEWVTSCLLLPGSSNNPACLSEINEDLVNPRDPATGLRDCTEKEGDPNICPRITYDIPFRDKTDIIPNDKKQPLIDKVKIDFDRVGTKMSMENLRLIEDRAIKAGWSPAFVTALWIEESGASSSLSNYPLGCIPQNVPRATSQVSLESSLDCLFKYFDNLYGGYANQFPYNFENFMLQYSAMVDLSKWRCFCTNPNFPGNIYNVYYETIKKL